MHAESKTIAATRQMFLKALAARENLREEYSVGVTLKSRGVTEPPIVTEISMWDVDIQKKKRIKLCS